MRLKTILFFLLTALALHAQMFQPGKIWKDTDGTHINAHGGGVLYHQGTYYWYGEHKADTTSAAMVGVTCYSSKDLLHWTNLGVALSVSDDPQSEITRGCVLERPKVIYNKVTKKFVMWFHLELKGKGYSAARYGVAVSDQPAGPFQFLYSKRSDAGQYPIDFTPEKIAEMYALDESAYQEWWTPEWTEAIKKGLFLKRDFNGGQMSRDQTIFVDDDGTAYHIFSSEDNLTLHISELTKDYTAHTGRYIRVAPSGQNEAPAILKRNGRYWMITSGCTGWAPNKARMFTARSIWGPWTQMENPCSGKDADITFFGQSTYILKVEGLKDAYIFMADIWRPMHPSDARYIWLPIKFGAAGEPIIPWKDEWSMDEFR